MNLLKFCFCAVQYVTRFAKILSTYTYIGKVPFLSLISSYFNSLTVTDANTYLACLGFF